MEYRLGVSFLCVIFFGEEYFLTDVVHILFIYHNCFWQDSYIREVMIIAFYFVSSMWFAFLLKMTLTFYISEEF